MDLRFRHLEANAYTRVSLGGSVLGFPAQMIASSSRSPGIVSPGCRRNAKLSSNVRRSLPCNVTAIGVWFVGGVDLRCSRAHSIAPRRSARTQTARRDKRARLFCAINGSSSSSDWDRLSDFYPSNAKDAVSNDIEGHVLPDRHDVRPPHGEAGAGALLREASVLDPTHRIDAVGPVEDHALPDQHDVRPAHSEAGAGGWACLHEVPVHDVTNRANRECSCPASGPAASSTAINASAAK